VWEGLVSGYAPIFHDDGSVAAIAGVEIDDRVLWDLYKTESDFRNLNTASVIVLFLCGIVGFWKLRRDVSVAEEADAVKTRFLHRIIREIRAPMNTIRGIAKSQPEGSEDLSSPLKDAFDKIQYSGDMLLQIFDDLLVFSKEEADKLGEVSGTYDTVSSIDEVVHLSKVDNETKSTEINPSINENSSSSLVDYSLSIKQIHKRSASQTSIDRAKVAKQAESYLASGRAAKAIDEFLKLLEDNPKDLSLTNRLGDIYLQENRLEEAMYMFKRVAAGFERDGFVNKAAAVLKKAIRSAPDDMDMVSRLIELYKRANMVREAIQIHLQIADSYIKKGLTPKALSEFTKIVELEPNNIKTRIGLAKLLQKDGHKEQAATIYLETAELLAADNLHTEASQIIERAKSLTTMPQLFLTQANLCIKQKDLIAAKNHLDEGLKINPINADLLNAKADVELQSNQPLVALKIIASIPKLSDDSLPICEKALQMCLKSGSIVNALEIISGNMLEMARRGFGDFAKLTLCNVLETQPIHEYGMLLAQIAHQVDDRAEQVDSLKYALSLLPAGDTRGSAIRTELQSLGIDPNDINDLAVLAPPVIIQGSGGRTRPDSAAPAPRQSMQIRQLQKEAEQLASNSYFGKAIETYHRLLEIDPINHDAIMRVAEIHKSSGMVTKAQVHFCKVAEKLASLEIPELALKYLDMAEDLISGSTRATRLMLGDALKVSPQYRQVTEG
jgi:tetratricopeptide (TPR) repeat protein